MAVVLRSGVGDGQPNRPEDVALVQLLLNGTPFGGLGVSGVFDGPTGAAIQAFQQHHFGFADRILSPGDIGFLRLRGSATGDPLLEAQRNMIIRAMVVHFAQGSDAAIGEVPLNLIRPAADGQGQVGAWVVGAGAASIHSHPRFGTWDVGRARGDPHQVSRDRRGRQ
ncbi:MAG: peptidoglycan-binding protein [Actinomycetota bacterium]|nr:peptidoglycan-binding protein [Actinomycetota bacterium]